MLSKASGPRPHTHSSTSPALVGDRASQQPTSGSPQATLGGQGRGADEGAGRTGCALRAPGLCSFPLPSVRLSLGPGCQHGSRGPSPCPSRVGGPFPREGRGGCGRSRSGNGRVAGSRPRALTRGRSLPHSQRKQARELLAALQKVVVPIYCTSFLAVEEDKQQKIARVRGAAGRPGRAGAGGVRARLPLTSLSPLHVQLLQLWEKNGYFDDSIIQQLQSPALGLGQYQVCTAP